MKHNASIVAQRLLNLYRQAHVILGGWSAVNAVFVAQADKYVIEELMQLPTGKMLVQHIENLRAGRTAMDTIDRELLPYGGMMSETVGTVPLTSDEWRELENAINAFTPDQAGLNAIQKNPVIQKFGDEWLGAIRYNLKDRPNLAEKWKTVIHTYRAYSLWDTATHIINQPLSERTRAQVQADMPEYETYLPMFGDAGKELLARLRMFITTRTPGDA